ncbi:hypothetical protein D9619_000119 [Psilocybe cf. subviscida]|uniref:Lysine-specific metallo-endopeptidase domain-containing protein n=1 Tax=Psilocybe cf. subviscida TaxID=2480587 RepID=A0A8H5BF27_9AGAR|nr:hypothetical protein D9619_000119 [Psilocybe cf. subviscida]
MRSTRVYDFSAAGAGKFSFVPKTDFVVVVVSAPDPLAKVATPSFTRVEASASPVEAVIMGDLAKREIEVLDRRAKNICTTSSKTSFIDSSYTEAKTLASTAVSYINSKGASDSLDKAYFGTTATSKVIGVLNAVANENSSSRTLSCVDSYNACSGGVIGYTVTSTTNVYFCSIFFNEVATSRLCSGTTVASRNVRGGTTLHELTHALAGTDDIT